MFALLFYSSGTGGVDADLSPADWLPFRHTGSKAVFLGIFLVPAFLPILLKIPPV